MCVEVKSTLTSILEIPKSPILILLSVSRKILAVFKQAYLVTLVAPPVIHRLSITYYYCY